MGQLHGQLSFIISPMGLKQSKPFYRERQVDDNCRVHCLNAVCGKRQLTVEQFERFCDEFDRQTNVTVGSSRQFFMPPTEDSNIFQFCLLRLKNWQTAYIAPGSKKQCQKRLI